ncbi:MAG: hypothetical protein ABI351_13920, partial [Herbaspirillum sp.]
MKLIILSLLFSSFALAGLPPTTLSGALSSGAKPTTFNFVAPFNQATKVSGVTSRVETGSENLLANSNFEASTLNWSFSGGGAGAAAANNTTFSPILEKQDMRINTGASGGIVVATSFNAGAGLTST